MKSIRFKNYSFSYKPGNTVLENITCELLSGKRYGLLGLNGTGKTTFLLAVSRLLPFAQEEGSVEKDLTTRMVFQNPDHQLIEEDAEEELALSLLAKNPSADKNQIRASVSRLMDDFRIKSFPATSTYDLSFGEKKLLTLAGAFIDDPDFFLFDEPTLSLDIRQKEAVVEKIGGLKCGFLISSHDYDILSHLVDEIFILKNKNIFYITDAKDFLHRREYLKYL
jgi:energy-coupling factor transporter ATP-binding protein EcfA2